MVNHIENQLELEHSIGRSRLVVLADGVFHTIVRTHLRLGHAGYKKTFAEIQDTYYGIVRMVEHKLRAWKMENDSTKWRDALLEMAMQVNSQKHSVIGYTPCNVVLRHHFRKLMYSWLITFTGMCPLRSFPDIT